VLTACWSIKGGSGTTVVAASLGLLLAARSPGGAVVADLGGDVPATLGLPPGEAGPPGLAGWLAAAPDVMPDALARLEVAAGGGLTVLPRGDGPLAAEGGALLGSVLAGDPRPVVADCGRLALGSHDDPAPPDAAHHVVEAADRSLLVIRPCFLAVQRATRARLRPTALVLVAEPGRALTRTDVEAALGVPVVACVRVTDGVARSVDAGLLATALPRSLARDLRHVA
jgi:hypothetical protein